MDETASSAPPPAARTGDPLPRGAAAVLTQFLLIPSALAAAALGVIVLFGLIASVDSRSPEECLREIEQRTGRDRWQAAHALAQAIASRKGPTAEDGRLAERMVSLYREFGRRAGADDPASPEFQVRRYLAIALGRLGHPAAREPLADSASEGPAELRIAAILALGALGDPGAVSDLASLLTDRDGEVRKAAVYAIGVLAKPGDGGAETALRGALGDAREDVAWNAALALARRGDAAGVPVLGRILDRAHLGTIEMTDAQRREALLNALRAVKHLSAGALRERIAGLSRDDPDGQVRQAASEALAALASGGLAVGEGRG
ncbi:MAG: HEAT repeat domain-containing protein [Planctomycetales bacterium]|nr:HEAT repeat domain-containing protein [Planctomycetales bacterium]